MSLLISKGRTPAPVWPQRDLLTTLNRRWPATSTTWRKSSSVLWDPGKVRTDEDSGVRQPNKRPGWESDGLALPTQVPTENHCALSSPDLVSRTDLAPPPKEERRIQSACSPNMIGYRQRWLQENRTWLYLSCLSPLYLYGPGECNVLTWTFKSSSHSGDECALVSWHIRF